MSASPRLSHKIFLAAGSAFAALLIAEGALRILSPLTGFYPQLNLRPNRRLHCIWPAGIPGVSPESAYTTNRLGIRGDEPPKDWNAYETLMTIGGSTTECAVLDDHKTWPYQLQLALQKEIPSVWVGNAATSGETTAGHLIVVDQVVSRIKPQTVLFLVGVNDLGRSFKGEDPAGTWKDWAGWKNRIIGNSRVLQLVNRTYKSRFGPKVFRQDLGFSNWPLLRKYQPFPKDLEPLLPSLSTYSDNLRKIIRRCKTLGVRPIFLTQPMRFNGSKDWEDKDSGFIWIPKRQLSAADSWRMLDVFNRELLRICREEGVECLDLASRIPPDSEFFYDQIHFTEQGAKRIGEEIARYLLRESPQPLSVQAPRPRGG